MGKRKRPRKRGSLIITDRPQHVGHNNYDRELSALERQLPPGLFVIHIYHDEQCCCWEGDPCNCDSDIALEDPFDRLGKEGLEELNECLSSGSAPSRSPF